MKKKSNNDKKLDEIYDFLDEKPKPTRKQLYESTKKLESDGLLKSFPEEKLVIDKNDTEIIKTFDKEEIIKEKPLTIQELTKIPSSIDSDLHENDMNIISGNTQSDLMRAFDSLSNPENMESNTILSNRQVIALSTINYLAQVYDIAFFKQFIKLFPRYRISGDNGRGRKELIEIANAIRRDKEEEHNRFMDLLGRR
jgi:hypothetical protein